MSIESMFFSIAAVWVVSAFISGQLLLLAAHLVRLPGLKAKRAIIMAFVVNAVGTAAFVFASYGPGWLAYAITGIFAAHVLVFAMIFIANETKCRRRHAIGAVALWLAMVIPTNFGLSFMFRDAIVDSFAQTGEAMEPTLLDGDRFLVERAGIPQRFDLIVFHPPHEPESVWVSRLIGLPGETVEIIGGRVHIDGEVLAFPAGLSEIEYEQDVSETIEEIGVEGNPIRLNSDEYFVLGDNTANSFDSRLWPAPGDPAGGYPGNRAGALPHINVVGVVRMVYAPLSRLRAFP